MDCVLEQQRRRLLRQDGREAGGVSGALPGGREGREASVWALSSEQWAATGGRGAEGIKRTPGGAGMRRSSCLSALPLPVSRWPPASRPKDACKGVRKQSLFQKPPLLPVGMFMPLTRTRQVSIPAVRQAWEKKPRVRKTVPARGDR